MVEWISHRGIRDASSGVCSENSYKAFILARDAGFTFLETDLRCTADGQLVLSHDHDLRRCFGSNLVVESAQSQDLRSLRGPYGDPLLFFDEFAAAFSDQGWVLDIKPESAHRVIDLLSKDPYRSLLRQRAHRTKFLFWNAPAQATFLAGLPDADCFARESECWRAGLAVLLRCAPLGRLAPGKTYSLPPRLSRIDLYKRPLFDTFHRKGAKVLAYLPETRAEAERAIDAGADFVLANSALFAR